MIKLPKLNQENGLIILIILLIGAYIGAKLFSPEVVTKTTIEETTTIDTTKVEIDTTFSEKATIRKPIKPIEIKPKTEESPEPEKYDSTRTYSGTHYFDYGKFDWKINTGGILDSYEFRPQIEVPTVTITKEKTVTQTRTIIQKGLFLGGGLNSQVQYHIGATYLGNKWMIEYNYSPAMRYGAINQPIPVHQVGFKYKIF